jgi:hypothetical protein
MSEATESLEHAEHIEHAAHAAGHGDGHGHGDGKKPGILPKAIGLTIAVLGVLLAVCAALVGSERTELISTTVQQSTANNEYQAEATRYRSTLAQVEALDAVDPGESPEGAKEIAAIGANARPESADVIAALRDATRLQIDKAAPDEDVVERLVKLARTHQKSSASAKAWADSHTPVIKAHFEAAEKFERCQLLTEIGIVIASVALLLGNRIAWVAALFLGGSGLALAVVTYVGTRGELHEAEAHLEEAHHAFQETAQSKEVANEDEDVLKSFEDSFKSAPDTAPAGAAPKGSGAAAPAAAPGKADDEH